MRRESQTVDAIFDDLQVTADGRHHDRHATRRSLDDGQAERLGGRRLDTDCRASDDCRHLLRGEIHQTMQPLSKLQFCCACQQR